MTTNVLVRYAETIDRENAIANFDKYSIKSSDISAISWELPGNSRRESGEHLLKMMAKKIFPENNPGELYVMVQLSSEQPDNVIVNYKKTWGLMKSCGVEIDKIKERSDIIIKSKDGLTLLGTGKINLNSHGVIKSLYNNEIKVYFALFKTDQEYIINLSNSSLSEWMDSVWNNNGLIFILLGHFDEKDCEVVALGKHEKLNSLLEFHSQN